MTDETIEVVIARYEENLNWISLIADDIPVTIYNKGNPINLLRLPRHAEIINIENIGRESETYARHIIKNYKELATYTLFLQGDPFPHCENFKNIIKNIKEFVHTYAKNFETIPLTHGWIIDKNIPYLSVFNQWKICLPMNLSNIFIDYQSTRTLDSLLYHDKGIHMIKETYMKLHNLPHGTNLIHHFLSLLGIGHLVPENTDTFYMFFAANFIVNKNQIHKHNIDIYKRLWKLNCEYSIYGFLTERSWLCIFGGANKILELRRDDREPITYSPTAITLEQDIILEEKIDVPNKQYVFSHRKYLPPFYINR